MIHDIDFFEIIDEYCLGQLSPELVVEFEVELAQNPVLKQELLLQKEIWSSISEIDVLTLRKKLGKIAKKSSPAFSDSDSFDLLNEFSEIKEISEVLSSEGLIDFFDSLPKIHAYHHEVTSNENIHEFYKNQNISDTGEYRYDVAKSGKGLELEGLEEAILEKDILELRQTIKLVAKSVEMQFNTEEIDAYVNNEMAGKELLDFKNQISRNRALNEEIELHTEVDMAIQEFDIMKMRSQISRIIQTETSWNVTEENIEDYIDKILEGELLEEFMSEMKDNTDLQAEIKLRKQINEFLSEKDVFELRKELQLAKEVSEVKQVKMLIPETKFASMKFWRNAAAVIIVLLGIAGVLRNGLVSSDQIYENYFETPSWSPERSLVEEITNLQQAKFAYLKSDFTGAINILELLPKEVLENPVSQFYKAASLQNLNQFEKAIVSYNKVLEDGDNLFIEEAEWYRCLCYLKSGEKIIAKQQLLAVIKRKGDFENDAKAVLRRLRYSVKN